jgi:IclR family transcriptional regulator, pca regulon regulatory protein
MAMDLRREEGLDSASAWTPAQDADVAAPGADRDFVASLARGLAVIQAFTNHQQRLTIAKISQRTGIARAAVRRYLHTLAELGYVVTHDGCRYSLLPKVISLGQAYLSATSMPPVVQAHLDSLAEEIGEACSLAVLDHLDIVYLARANSSSVMSPRFNVGGRLPAHCTSIGRVLLADLPASVLEDRLRSMRFIPYTPRTVHTPVALLECLASVRAEGFAIADQQLEAGFRSIAVAVRNSAGDVAAGLNVIVPVARASIDQMRTRYLQPLITSAAGLGAALAP